MNLSADRHDNHSPVQSKRQTLPPEQDVNRIRSRSTITKTPLRKMERLEQLQQSAVESKEQRRKINLLDDEKKAY